MEEQCQNKAVEWDARQKSAAGEMEAIEKAKEILSSGVKALVQTSVSHKTVKASVMNSSRKELIHLLKKMGREYNSFALMQMANKAKSDPFVKVRGLVEDMIAKLEKQALEEATHDAWCKEEDKKSKASRDAKQAKVDKYTARLDKAKASVATLQQEVAELSEQLNDIAKLLVKLPRSEPKKTLLTKLLLKTTRNLLKLLLKLWKF